MSQSGKVAFRCVKYGALMTKTGFFLLALAMCVSALGYEGTELGYFERLVQKQLEQNLDSSSTFSELLEKYRPFLAKREYQLLERQLKKQDLETLPKDKARSFYIINIMNHEFRVMALSDSYNPKLKLKKRLDLMKATLQKAMDAKPSEDEVFLYTLIASATLGTEQAQFAQNVERCRAHIDSPGREASTVQLLQPETPESTYHAGQVMTLEFKINEGPRNLKRLVAFGKKTKRIFTIMMDETGDILQTRLLNEGSELKPSTGTETNQVAEKIPDDLKPGKYKTILCVETPKNLLGNSTVDGVSHTFMIAQDTQASRIPASKPALRRHHIN